MKFIMMFSSVFSFHFLPFLFQFQQHTSQFLQGWGSKTETQVTLQTLIQCRGFYLSNSSSAMERKLTGVYPDTGTLRRHNSIPPPLIISRSVCDRKGWQLTQSNRESVRGTGREGRGAEQRHYLQRLFSPHHRQLNVLPTRLHNLHKSNM